MKTPYWLMFSLIMLLTCGNATADEQNAHAPKAGDRFERMQENLGLSEAQVEQMRALFEQGADRAAIRAVLTDEQRAAQRQRHRAARKEGGKHRGRGSRHQRGRASDDAAQQESTDAAAEPQGNP